jgi:anaerobic magnesium-protoporphyrin IX monomethyl ester cyclase
LSEAEMKCTKLGDEQYKWQKMTRILNSYEGVQNHCICVITGGLLSVDERSVWQAIRKQLKQYRQSKHQWLETKIKIVSAEPVLLARIHPKNKRVEQYFSSPVENLPDLTEVVLIDEIAKQGLEYASLTCDAIFQMNTSSEAIINNASVLFISTTLLHDLSELNTILQVLEKYNKRIVLGGALAGSLYKYWEGDARVDILAIGYGEYLIPILCEWIKSDFTLLDPKNGKLSQSNQKTKFLFSALPKDKLLDFIERPRWNNLVPDKSYRKIAYESVRGCPYRCSFCNYPYLFNDKVFRMKSARKIADDWEKYANEGVEHIVCLDSLFTLPKQRAEELCNLLIKRNVKLHWTCYARADDLGDKEFVQLMYDAGARQFQIGVESGSQLVLDAMNKKCTVASNQLAIQNCREVGITSVVSVIVGFPEETEQTISETIQFLHHSRPDFHFLATFSVRVEDVPILNEQNRKKYGLIKYDNPYSMAPYWKHTTMSCEKVGTFVRQMNEYLITNKISLDGSIFYRQIDYYKPELRNELLEFQYQCFHKHNIIRSTFDLLNKFVDKKLKADINQIEMH